MWNVQEKGSSKAMAMAALRNHHQAKPRQASVEGVTVTIPPQIPATVLSAVEALLSELPEATADQVIALSVWSDASTGFTSVDMTLNVNVAYEAVPKAEVVE